VLNGALREDFEGVTKGADGIVIAGASGAVGGIGPLPDLVLAEEGRCWKNANGYRLAS
jgi:hypothetical protein